MNRFTGMAIYWDPVKGACRNEPNIQEPQRLANQQIITVCKAHAANDQDLRRTLQRNGMSPAASVFCTDESGPMKTQDTPLHLVLQVPGKTAMINTLLENKADPNAKNFHGVSCLMAAASRNVLEIIPKMVESPHYQIKLDVTDSSGRTALVYGAPYAEIAHYLLDKGADPNVVPRYARGPISAAITGDHPRTVELVDRLIEATSVEVLQTPTDGWHSTVIGDMCCRGEDKWLAQVIKLVEKVGYPKVEYDGWEAGENDRRFPDTTPFHSACRYQGVGIVKFLLTVEGVDVNYRLNKTGFTPLMDACQGAEKHKGSTVALYLLEQTMKPIDVTAVGKDGITALHLAASNGLTDVVERCLAKNANVELLTATRDSALTLACKGGFTATALVLARHANAARIAGVANESGNTALHYACSKSPNLELVELLINLGTDINLVNRDRQTPLVCAFLGASVSVISSLLQRKAAGLEFIGDMAAQATDGQATPLHIIAATGDVATVRALVKAGLSTKIRDETGLTPIICAYKAGRMDIVAYLLSLSLEFIGDMEDLNRVGVAGKTILHYTVDQGYGLATGELLERGCHVPEGSDYIGTACERGHVSIVTALVRHLRTLRVSGLSAAAVATLARGLGFSLAEVSEVDAPLELNNVFISECSMESGHELLQAIGKVPLEALSIHNCDLTDRCVEQVQLIMADRKTMASLRLTDCKLNSTQGKVVAETIRKNNSLTHLCLTGNAFSSLDCVRNLMTAVRKHKKLRRVKVVEIFGSVRWTEVIKMMITYSVFGVYLMIAGLIRVSHVSTDPNRSWWKRLFPCYGMRVDFSESLSPPTQPANPNTQFICTILYVLMIVLPFVLPWAIMQAPGADAVHATAWISVFLALLMLWVLAVAIVAYCDENDTFTTVDEPATHVRFFKKKKPYFWWKNFLGFALLLYDWAQLTALSFAGTPDIYPESTKMQPAMTPFLLDFGSSTFRASFFFAVGLGLLWWLIASYLASNALTGNVVGALASFKQADMVSGLLSNAFFLAIVSNLLKVLNCRYEVGTVCKVAPCLEAEPDMICWTGVHNAYATVGMLVLVLYIMSATSIGLEFTEDHSGKCDIQFVEMYTLFERVLKLLAAIAIMFYSRGRDNAAGLLVLLAVQAILFVVLLRTKPSTIKWITEFKATLILMVSWSAVCGVIANVWGLKKSWLIFGLFVGGIFLIPLAASLISYGRYRREKHEAYLRRINRVRRPVSASKPELVRMDSITLEEPEESSSDEESLPPPVHVQPPPPSQPPPPAAPPPEKIETV